MNLFNPLPLIINPPHTPNNKYSQYIIVYHIWGVFIFRGVGGFIIRGGDYLLQSLQATLFAILSIDAASEQDLAGV